METAYASGGKSFIIGGVFIRATHWCFKSLRHLNTAPSLCTVYSITNVVMLARICFTCSNSVH